jgi:hypothetical protein
MYREVIHPAIALGDVAEISPEDWMVDQREPLGA